MVVNDNAGNQMPNDALVFFASELAPTENSRARRTNYSAHFVSRIKTLIGSPPINNRESSHNVGCI